MGAYNIVNAASMVGGQPEDVSQVLANLQAIQAVINGGIDNTNINNAANILLSKLNGYPADATKFARGDGTWAVPPAMPNGTIGQVLAYPGTGQPSPKTPASFMANGGSYNIPATGSIVMYGLGSSAQLTPAFSSTAIIMACGYEVQPGTFGGGRAQLSVGFVGSGVPAQGAAAAGSAFGFLMNPGGTAPFTICLIAQVAAMVVGTAYWFDLQVMANSGGSTGSVAATIVGFEY